jgi:hypothetical protein
MRRRSRYSSRDSAVILRRALTDVDLSPVRATALRIRIIGSGADSKSRVADVEIFGRVERTP